MARCPAPDREPPGHGTEPGPAPPPSERSYDELRQHAPGTPSAPCSADPGAIRAQLVAMIPSPFGSAIEPPRSNDASTAGAGPGPPTAGASMPPSTALVRPGSLARTSIREQLWSTG